MLYGRNLAYRSNVLTQVGLFNESLVAAEDMELNWRIENAGYGLIFSPRMIVYHSHRSNLWLFIKQHFRNGVGCGQLAKVNPRLRHTRLRLLSTAGVVSGLCLLIAFALSRLSAILFLLIAMILGYVLYCVSHGASVCNHTRSNRDIAVAFLLTMIWPPFWSLGILYGLTKPTTSSPERPVMREPGCAPSVTFQHNP